MVRELTEGSADDLRHLEDIVLIPHRPPAPVRHVSIHKGNSLQGAPQLDHVSSIDQACRSTTSLPGFDRLEAGLAQRIQNARRGDNCGEATYVAKDPGRQHIFAGRLTCKMTLAYY